VDFLHIEGFEKYTTITQALTGFSAGFTGWSVNENAHRKEGHVGARAVSSGNGFQITAPVSGSANVGRKIIMGMVARLDGLPSISSDRSIMTLLNSFNHIRAEILSIGDAANPHRQVKLSVGGAEATELLPMEEWFVLEWEIILDTTGSNGGLSRVLLNGNPIIEVTDEATVNGGGDIVRARPAVIASYNRGVECFYVAYGDASMEPLGNFEIVTLTPTSDDSVDFAPATGTDNYAMVQKAEDTGYNESLAAGDRDLFGHDAEAVGDILAVQHFWRARKDGTDIRSLRGLIGDGTTTAETFSHELNTSFASLRHLQFENPLTSAPWTAADVNGLLSGYETFD
jgi:hypothetical protein